MWLRCTIIFVFVFFTFALQETFAKGLKKNINQPNNCLIGKPLIGAPSSISHLSKSSDSQNIVQMRGGTTPSSKSNLKRNLLGLWGILQVVSITINAVKRLVPIALRPFVQGDFTPQNWILYVLFSLFMAYSEGYRGFHLKFSPLVVSRAFNLYLDPSFINVLLAGPYSMGMFGASKKRVIISWSITAGVFAIVRVVKYIPYPYKSIVDAGVVVGLTCGTLSIFFHTLKALFRGPSPSIE